MWEMGDIRHEGLEKHRELLLLANKLWFTFRDADASPELHAKDLFAYNREMIINAARRVEEGTEVFTSQLHKGYAHRIQELIPSVAEWRAWQDCVKYRL
jgi:hypothetical protein